MHKRSTPSFIGFVLEAIGLTVLITAIGWVPTQRVAGSDAISGLLAGCGVSLAASVLSAIPAAFQAGRIGRSSLGLMTVGMALRMVLALGGGLALAQSGWFMRGPLLIWLAISYAALLVVDTRFVLKAVGAGK